MKRVEWGLPPTHTLKRKKYQKTPYILYKRTPPPTKTPENPQMLYKFEV